MMETPAPSHGDRKTSGGTARRWLLRIALVLLTLLVLAGLLVFATFKTEWGSRALWQAASHALADKLSGDVVGGTLASGLQLRNVVYRDAARQVKIDRLAASWSWSRSPLKLTVERMHIGELYLTQYPTPKQPPSVPKQLSLPLAVELNRATLQKLVIRQDDSTTTIGDIAIHGRSDGVNHSLTLEHAETPYGAAQARLQLGGTRPFPISGAAGLAGAWLGERYRLDTTLSGSLEALQAQVIAAGDRLNGTAQIEASVFSDSRLRRAQVALRHLNPRMFSAGMPSADLDIDANLVPHAGAAPESTDAKPLILSGPVSLKNHDAGPLDQQLLPLVTASAQVRVSAHRQQLQQLQVQLTAGGTVQGDGELHDGTGRFLLQAHDLDLHALYGKLRHTQLGGPLTVELEGNTQHIKLDLDGPSLAISGNARIDPQQIVLNNAVLQAASARLKVNGTLNRSRQRAFSARGTLSDFNPARFLASADAPEARINMQFDAQGSLQPDLQVQLAFDIDDSTYAGLPMTGNGRLRLNGKQIAANDTQVSIANNHLQLSGSFGEPGERLRFALDAPALARLGFGLSGLLRAQGEIGGSVERPEIDASYRANRLVFRQYRVADASGQMHTNGVPARDPDARVTLELDASGVQAPDLNLTRLHAAVEGSYASHNLTLKGNGQVRGRPLALALTAHGRLEEQTQGYAWDGQINSLENRGFPRLALERPLALSVAPTRLALGPTRLTLEQAQVELQSLQLDEQTISSEGSFNALAVAHLLEIRRELTGAQPPVKTDLVLDGRWNFSLAESARGFLQVERRSGDLRLPGDRRDTTLGLSALRLHGDFQDRLLKFSAQAAARRVGTVESVGQIALQPVDGRLMPAADSTLDGRITATIPRLQTLASLAGPRIALDGSVAADMTLGGTLTAPVITGDATGKNLSLTLYDQGVHLHDGNAQIHIEDNIADIRQLEFHGQEGTLRVTGRVPLERSEDTTATLVANNLQLLASPSRQMTVSGRAEAANVDRQLQINGKFTVNQARFSLPEQSAPALGDDVRVIRGTRRDGTVREPQNVSLRTEKPAGPLTPRIRLLLDLGNDFRFQGSGADLQLGGELTVMSAPGETPRANGTVRIIGGTYEAFGAKLEIERGVLNFQGSFSNPNIDILAMRREQEVAAGVHATGTVRQPRVQLVSEPDVPEQEKLNWLVFGRGGSSGAETGSGQAQAAAKEAALGLVNKFGGTRIAKGFGLDQLAIGSSEYGLGAQQVVSLGKEISNRLSIGYEQSLAGAEGVLKLTYELSRHWSVVIRGGTIGGMDVFYSKRFDSLDESGTPR